MKAVCYQCPDCSFHNRNWFNFKTHLVKHAGHEDLKTAKKADFDEFLVNQDDTKKQDLKTNTANLNSEIDLKSYSEEPSTRLREILEVNLPEFPDIIKKVCHVFALSPYLESDLPGLERLLTAHFGTGKKLLIQNCLSQYGRQPYTSQASEELGPGTMTIFDSNGNPMRLPVDKGLIEAIRNKTIAETEFVKMQQLREMGNPGNEVITALTKQVEDMRKQLYDEKIKNLEVRLKTAEELAANPETGKGVLDTVSEAGEDVKELLLGIGKEVKSSLEDGLGQIAKAVNHGKEIDGGFGDGVIRTPEQIASIMETENLLLACLPDSNTLKR
jgi:hypothetical protein